MTPFAKRVLKAVLQISPGQVRTYKWVAQRAGFPRAWRAVGTVLRKNPYPLIIPCHRVVKCNNKLGEYSFGGAKRKKLFLDLERRIAECLETKE